MENNMWKKGMVLAIVCCFIGASVLPSIGGVAQPSSKKHKEKDIEFESSTFEPLNSNNKDDWINLKDNQGGGSIIVTLESNSYCIYEDSDGYSHIEMEGFGFINSPGSPRIPSKVFLIGVPPGAIVHSVDVIGYNCTNLSGTYNIVPSPPSSRQTENEEKLCSSNVNTTSLYYCKQTYPSDKLHRVYRYLGMGQMRKYKLAQICFNPFLYDVKEGKLVLYNDMTLQIGYEIEEKVSDKQLQDEVIDEIASKKIYNYECISGFYIPSTVNVKEKVHYDTYDYVIIIYDHLKSSVNLLESWKEGLGYSVKIVTISEIESSYSGIDLSERIRNFLRDIYIEWGIKYVLIVGSHSAIPMRECYPDNPVLSWDRDYPTDYYYADLTGDWDYNGNKIFGERYPTDQAQLDDNSEIRLYGNKKIAQSFRPTRTDGLKGFYISCYKIGDFEGDLCIRIRNSLNGADIRNLDIPGERIGQYSNRITTIFWDPVPPVTPEKTYYAVYWNSHIGDENHCFAIKASTENPYDRGQYYEYKSGSWINDGDIDLVFATLCKQSEVDFSPEVYVGRIPFDSTEEIERICQKIVAYEANVMSWKKNVLELGAILNFANENGNVCDKTDGAYLMEECWDDIYEPNNFFRTTMYEKDGIDPSSFFCNMPLNNDNVVNEWTANGYGIVNWFGHGSKTEAFRKIWTQDDGDHIPEEGEIMMTPFISKKDSLSLNDTTPAIVFSCSCLNSRPGYNNIGKALLDRGAVAFIGATQVSYYIVGDILDLNGANDYYFFDYLINKKLNCGDALYESKEYVYYTFPSGPCGCFWPSYENTLAFNLYGDPALALELSNYPPNQPSNPYPEDDSRNISINITLDWADCTDPEETEVSYDVYLKENDYPGEEDIITYDIKVSNCDVLLKENAHYFWKVIARDNDGLWREGPIWNFYTIDIIPPILTIDGTINGKAGEEYNYTFVATDPPDNGDVYYYIEWGDNNTEEWIGPHASGGDLNLSHTWEEQGTYIIRAKAKDVFDNEGDWATLEVTMPRNKAINTPFLNYLQNFLTGHPGLFPILRYLLGL